MMGSDGIGGYAPPFSGGGALGGLPQQRRDVGAVGGQAEAPFDLSEFPALSGQPNMGGFSTIMGNSTAEGLDGSHPTSSRFFNISPDSTSGSGPTAAAVAAMQPQSHFAAAKEDFPALPRPAPPSTGKDDVSDEKGSSSVADRTPTVPLNPEAKYGLLGLLGVIKMTDPDLNTLALGSDLTTLGLNLNAAKPLYATFSSPWENTPSKSEPSYQIPMCYYMQQTPPLKHAHLQKFHLETLFYIFYAMPKDLLQVYAARELYAREWKYHAEMKRWFRRAAQLDVPTTSQAQFVFFDTNIWDCRLYNQPVTPKFVNGLLKQEEIEAALPQQQASS